MNSDRHGTRAFSNPFIVSPDSPLPEKLFGPEFYKTQYDDVYRQCRAEGKLPPAAANGKLINKTPAQFWKEYDEAQESKKNRVEYLLNLMSDPKAYEEFKAKPKGGRRIINRPKPPVIQQTIVSKDNKINDKMSDKIAPEEYWDVDDEDWKPENQEKGHPNPDANNLLSGLQSLYDSQIPSASQTECFGAETGHENVESFLDTDNCFSGLQSLYGSEVVCAAKNEGTVLEVGQNVLPENGAHVAENFEIEKTSTDLNYFVNSEANEKEEKNDIDLIVFDEETGGFQIGNCVSNIENLVESGGNKNLLDHAELDSIDFQKSLEIFDKFVDLAAPVNENPEMTLWIEEFSNSKKVIDKKNLGEDEVDVCKTPQRTSTDKENVKDSDELDSKLEDDEVPKGKKNLDLSNWSGEFSELNIGNWSSEIPDKSCGDFESYEGPDFLRPPPLIALQKGVSASDNNLHKAPVGAGDFVRSQSCSESAKPVKSIFDVTFSSSTGSSQFQLSDNHRWPPTVQNKPKQKPKVVVDDWDEEIAAEASSCGKTEDGEDDFMFGSQETWKHSTRNESRKKKSGSKKYRAVFSDTPGCVVQVKDSPPLFIEKYHNELFNLMSCYGKVVAIRIIPTLVQFSSRSDAAAALACLSEKPLTIRGSKIRVSLSEFRHIAVPKKVYTSDARASYGSLGVRCIAPSDTLLFEVPKKYRSVRIWDILRDLKTATPKQITGFKEQLKKGKFRGFMIFESVDDSAFTICKANYAKVEGGCLVLRFFTSHEPK